MRLMAVCHDSVGIGHLRRTLAIAERAVQTIPSCRVLVVSGTLHASYYSMPDKVDYVKLPSLRKGPDYRYCAKSLGVNLQDIISIRSSILTATTASYRPDVLLIDKSPLGVQGEAETSLKLVRDRYPATRVIFGMRDIEDAPEQTKHEWRKHGHLEALKYLADEIWVYGDPAVFDAAEAYDLPPEITEKMHYVGYIARPACAHASAIKPGERNGAGKRLLVTVGGGTDGFRLLDQFLSASPQLARDMGLHTRIVGGPDLPRAQADQLRLRASAFPNTDFVDTAGCMGCEYQRADAVLCMGGYNTMLEVLQLGKPMLVYPRVEPRLEQYIRARRFAARGYCEVLDPNCVNPDRILEAVGHVLANHRPGAVQMPNLDGLTNVAERLGRLEAVIRDSVAVFV